MLAAAAVLAGARSIAAITEWAARTHPSPCGPRSGPATIPSPAGGRGPSPRDHDPPDARPRGPRGAGRRDRRLACRPRPSRPARPASTSGGGRRQDATRRPRQRRPGPAGPPAAAMDHATRTVLGQRQVDGAPGEVPAFQPLLDGLELAGVVVTADALHPTPMRPSSSWPASRPTTCSPSRPTSPRSWPAAPAWPGTTSG
jgi:hypothetical protein